MQLSLDHITVTDTTPGRLAEIAAATGCSGVCLFLHSMEVLPAMPPYDLVRDAAAELGAPLTNVLCYDRDSARRTEKLVELAELAGAFGIGLAIEFYPPAQVRTIAETLAEIDRAGRDDIGVTLDLLHATRGGDTQASMALLDHPAVRIGQISDGPASMAANRIDWEAGIQRLLPGEGAFDIPGFVRALAPGVPISVEVPQQAAMDAGVPALDRARAAVYATRACLAGAMTG